MTSYEDIARQRLHLVHSTDRLERRFPDRHRNIEALLFGIGLVLAAILGPWLFVAAFFSLAVS